MNNYSDTFIRPQTTPTLPPSASAAATTHQSSFSARRPPIPPLIKFKQDNNLSSQLDGNKPNIGSSMLICTNNSHRSDTDNFFEGFSSSDSSRNNRYTSADQEQLQQPFESLYDFLQPAIDHRNSTYNKSGADEEIESLKTDIPYQPKYKRHYLEDMPPQPLIDKSYSLVPDMIFGWVPKIQINGAIPLRFKNDVIDTIISELSNPRSQSYAVHKLCYVGFRPPTSIEMHEKYSASTNPEKCTGYSLKNNCALLKEICPNIPLMPKNNPSKSLIRPNEGNNPMYATRQDILKFDSTFESGNLDLAVKVGGSSSQQLQHSAEERVSEAAIDEYDLFMRVDSNTRGHFQWYYFVVSNTKRRQTVKFNICNFYKKKSLYSRVIIHMNQLSYFITVSQGMKPYVSSLKDRMKKGFSEEDYDTLGFEDHFQQCGKNVTYSQQKFRYPFLYATKHDGDPCNEEEEDDYEEPIGIAGRKQTFCLSYEYEFQYDDDKVSFAFCVPYTYTRLQKYIRRAMSLHGNDYLTQEKLCQSLSGVDVPLLTISDKDDATMTASLEDNNQKKVVMISSRIHPGESNSSWIMQGMLSFLLGSTPAAVALRKTTIFKIIPMLNPDGVILGNYRTGFAGRDLNRVFHTSDKLLFPTVIAMKDLVNSLKLTYGKRFGTYMDFHGHSIKKNAFVYGPEFPIHDAKYFLSRALPKLIGNATDMFRYHSSIFKISRGKRNTGRAVLFRQLNIPMSYTLEASNGTYGEAEPFNAARYAEIGKVVTQAMHAYFNAVASYEKTSQRKKKALEESRTVVQSREVEGDEDSKNEDEQNAGDQKNKKSNKAIGEKKKKKLKTRVRSLSSTAGGSSSGSTVATATTAEQQITMDLLADSPFVDLFKNDVEKENTTSSSSSNNSSRRGDKLMPLKGKQTSSKVSHESDEFSEGGSDAESSDEDYDKKDLLRMRENIEQNQRMLREMMTQKSTSSKLSKTFFQGTANRRQSSSARVTKKINEIKAISCQDVNNSSCAISSTRTRNNSTSLERQIKPPIASEKRGIYVSKTIRPSTTVPSARAGVQPYNITPIEETEKADENSHANKRRHSSQLNRIKTDPSQAQVKSNNCLASKDLNPIVRPLKGVVGKTQSDVSAQKKEIIMKADHIAATTSKKQLVKSIQIDQVINIEDIFALRSSKASRLLDLQNVLRGGNLITRTPVTPVAVVLPTTTVTAASLYDEQLAQVTVSAIQTHTPKTRFGLDYIESSISQHTSRRAKDAAFKSRTNYPSAFYAIKKHFHGKKKDEQPFALSSSFDKTTCCNSSSSSAATAVLPIKTSSNTSGIRKRSISFQPPNTGGSSCATNSIGVSSLSTKLQSLQQQQNE